MHLLDVNGPAHIFYEAKEMGAPIDLHFVTLSDDTEVESSAGLFFSRLEPYTLFELNEGDYVFVPGLEYQVLSDENFRQNCSEFIAWLKVQYARGAKICSVCTGIFLLAETGLLDEKICTTHWKYFSRFHQKFPKVELKKNRLFTDYDHIYTSAGVSSGIDLALYILEGQFVPKFAINVAKEVVVYFRRSESDPQLSIFLQYRNHLEGRIHDAQDLIARSISTHISLIEIADKVNMSSRNLTRLFKRTTGITIGAYVEKIRIERAVKLLAEGNKVEFVANKCGLKSANQLRSLLKKYQGAVPVEINAI